MAEPPNLPRPERPDLADAGARRTLAGRSFLVLPFPGTVGATVSGETRSARRLEIANRITAIDAETDTRSSALLALASDHARRRHLLPEVVASDHVLPAERFLEIFTDRHRQGVSASARLAQRLYINFIDR